MDCLVVLSGCGAALLTDYVSCFCRFEHQSRGKFRASSINSVVLRITLS